MSTKSIFLIGDSISVQYGPYLEQYLGSQCRLIRKQGLAEALVDLDRPRGANGGDSARVLAYLRELDGLGGVDADLLLVNCGLHDIRRSREDKRLQLELKDYVANLKAAVALVRPWRAKLVWIRSTPVPENVISQRSFTRSESDLEEYNQAADTVMAGAGVPMIDLHSFTAGLGPDLYCDHVHFIDSVRRQQGAFLAGWVLDHLSKSPSPSPL